MRNQFLWTAGIVLAAVGFGLGARAASPYDDPNVRQGSNPATQTIGLKPCGAKWIPYSEVCPLYQSTSDKAPQQLTRDPALLARTSIFDDCDTNRPYWLAEPDDKGKYRAVPPPKDMLARAQPWSDIGKARGLKWGCRLGSFDDYLINDVHGDACARGSSSWCDEIWWNQSLIDPKVSGAKRILEGPVAERIAMVRGIQRELKLPERMIVDERDCAGPVLQDALFAFGKRTAEGTSLATPHWVECAVRGRAASWGLSPAVTLERAQCKGSFAKYLCETSTVVVEGKKHVHESMLHPDPALHQISGAIKWAQEYIGKCDNRLADEALTTTNKEVPWKKKHLEMIRENCLVAAAMIADPEVSAWATSVAATLDQAIARKR